MEELLKEKNLKVTKNRIKVIEYIKNKKYVSLEEIINNLNIDKSTIYRIIEIFLENDILTTITIDNEKKYVLSTEHIHILKCIKCNNQTEIDTCPFEKEKYDDFIVLKHSVIIEGICKKCQKK